MTAANRTGAFRALRFAAIVALAGLGVAAFLVVGSYVYWQEERKSDLVSQRNLQDLRARLETVKRERDDLQVSASTYESLIARGAFVAENRLDAIEALEQLRNRHRLMGLEYAVSAQRPLKFATDASYAAVNILASRVQLKIQAYHDGDLVAFLDEFPRIQRGFFPIDRCAIKPVAEVGPRVLTADASPAAPVARIEADCTLEWITLVDKSKPANVRASVDSRKPL
jgi:hypothetical protein